MFQKIINPFSLHPKKLFLIDGLGAMLSAFLLGIVLVELENIFGIPTSVLYCLATFPTFFALVDFYAIAKGNNTKMFLKIIAALNLFYGILSLIFVVMYFEKMTFWGSLYLILEMVIVTFLAFIELKVAENIH